MDVGHINKKICHGVQCKICREKVMKLFTNVKDYLIRCVYTYNLMSANLLVTAKPKNKWVEGNVRTCLFS